MFSAAELEGLPEGLVKIFAGLQDRILLDIVRRLKANAGEITRSADWQIYRLHELGAASDDIKAAIQDALRLADDEVDAIYDAVLAEDYVRMRALYERMGRDVVPYTENAWLMQLVDAIRAQTREELHNITGTLGVAASNKEIGRAHV